MRILVVDDLDYKLRSIEDAISEISCETTLETARCFQTARKKMIDFQPDIIILDMSIPTSEREDGSLEGRVRMYGGRDLLEELEYYGIEASVIILTQFEFFGIGDERVSFEVLLKRLEKRFPKYLKGGVFYDSINSSWRVKLLSVLHSLISRK